MTSFKRNCIFGDFIQKRTISSGRSAQFPVLGRFTAKHYAPGKFIEGQGNMEQNEVVIRIDDYLTAAADVYDLDQAKAHYDYRAQYSIELGEALARAYDARIARLLTIGARTSTGDLTANKPSASEAPFRTGTRVDLNKATPTADDLVASVFSAAEALDKKDVSNDARVLVCDPASYYTLIQSSRAVNFDWNQQGTNGSYKEGQIVKLAGFSIFMSNHIAQGNVSSAPAQEQGYVFNGSVTKSNVDMSQTKMLAFQRNAVACVALKDIAMSMTGNDYQVTYNATKIKGQYAIGAGVLRPECCVEVYNSK